VRVTPEEEKALIEQYNQEIEEYDKRLRDRPWWRDSWIWASTTQQFMAGVALAMLGSLVAWGWQHHQQQVAALATSGAVSLLISVWCSYHRRSS